MFRLDERREKFSVTGSVFVRSFIRFGDFAPLTANPSYAMMRTLSMVGAGTRGDASVAGRKGMAITERQFAVLRVLWANGPLTVRGLMEHLPRGDRQPYTTVLGLLQGMERAGLVDHEKQGITHRYRPLVSQEEGTGSLLSDFLARFFHGSAEQLVLGLVDAQELAPDELRGIEARLADQGARASATRANGTRSAPAKKRKAR
jgi:BlaI family transcriptional regulator, penicillinase repressor